MAKKNKSNQRAVKSASTSTSSATPSPSARTAGGKPKPWYPWAVFLLGFALYANTFQHDFTLDDAIVITDNMFTQQGVSGIPGLLKYDTFYGFFKDPSKARLVAGGRYRPLTPVMFAVEKSLFGAHHRLAGHVINALLYGLTGAVIYWLALALFRDRPEGLFVALGTAVIFVCHPVHTEAVANIKGRDEIVALLGSLAALLWTYKALQSKQLAWTLPAMLAFFLALLSKENAITFLAVAPLTLYYFSRAKAGAIAAYTVPLLLPALIFLLIRGAILGWKLGDPPMELMNNPFLKIVNNEWVPFNAAEKSATIMTTLWEYLRLLVWPHPLTHDYYPRHVDIAQWSQWKPLLALALHLALLTLAILGLRRKDPVSYGIWYYLITLSIVSNIVFAVGTNMSERFIYMPSVGFALALSVLAYRLPGGKSSAALPVAGLACIGIIALALCGKTLLRNAVWKDNLTLFTTDVKTSARSAKVRNAAGGELYTQAIKPENEARREAMLRQAVGHLQEAVRIHPTYKNAYLLLGNCYNYLKEYEASIQAYQNALRIDADYTDAKENLGITYREAGKYYGETEKNLSKALEYLNKAYEMRPTEFETVRLLGVAYGANGNFQESERYFLKALEINDQHADTWFDLGLTYLYAGLNAKADPCIAKAKALDAGIEERRRR